MAFFPFRKQLFVCQLCLSFFLCVSQVRAQRLQQNKSPNIVLIVSDDHGREAVGCYGNKVVQTPNIDKLAAEGTLFTNAFCTVASCSPSRSVILSGLQSHANGMYGLEHQKHHFSSLDSVQSLPVLLQQAGYRTARIGKFHIAPEQVYHFEQVLQEGGVNNPTSIGRSPVEMADRCQAFINDSSAQPFFLYFATDDPHRSNTTLPDGTPFFDGSKPNPFGNRAQGYPQIRETVYQPEEVIVPEYLPDTRATREELAQYYQSISRLDQGIGRLIEQLKASGKYDNTVIVYLSDNGAPFPGSKTTLYEAGMRLPLIVKMPQQQKKGLLQDALVSWVDITPTLLHCAAALPDNVPFHGRSFKNIIEQQIIADRYEVYASHSLHEIMMYYPMRVLREKRFKLIYNIAHELHYPQALDLYQSYTWQSVLHQKLKNLGGRTLEAYLHRPKFELYDLQKDPHEWNNLSTDPRYLHELHRMQQKLKSWQKETQDPWLSKWDFE